MDAFRSAPIGAAPARAKAILVIGLGNPILGDDGVGWRVAEEVAGRLASLDGGVGSIEVDCFALGGLSLMERMVGYDRAVVIDAITTGAPAGTVRVLSLEECDALPDHTCAHTTAVHDTTLPTAVRLGRELGAELPAWVDVVGIEAQTLYEFTECLTPAVAGSVAVAAERVLALLPADGQRGASRAQSKEQE